MSESEWPAGRWGAGALLPRLDARIAAELVRLGRPVAFAPGDVLIEQGERTRHALLLRSGWVKVVAAHGGSATALLALRGPGDMVGELGALDGQPRSASVIAVSRVSGLRVPEGDLHGWLRRSPEAALALNRYVSAKFREATRFRVRAAATVEARMASLLWSLGDTYGSPSGEGVLIEAPLTQQELAGLVNASRAQVQRSLAELRRSGVISTGYRRIVIRDRGRLTLLAERADV
ncbi:Crp/Fnr family transcriptional regulator [Streptomyces sp. DSM 44917]|uniref:Crp/Fnr family transcriptional regulator n=1 Tax=Streptomyces boetiae TaxID=3075541 RepID=A0ABU2L8W5_9ACTN|nr:Crp/Fnr family transcriptional regulator [Streptomyces sp. DSM 44917]MDT0308013.1 Crp/Fnr family transcriptional regulator [Streptomyces sp. DSM 44917]